MYIRSTALHRRCPEIRFGHRNSLA
jgi:hypothetical protein